ACCQFDPKWGDVEGNMNKASSLLREYKEGDIDILILPEMAFTGYVFNSIEEIMPYLEDSEKGPTVKWAKEQETIAIRLKCFVIVGYPQKKDQFNYNSICCVNSNGEVILTYQKSFLYETDENWATEGSGFISTHINGLGKVGFGICMDLNPYKFKANFYDYEFANYHLNQDTEIILCSMAWLKSKEDNDMNNYSIANTVKYWASRLLPLMKTKKHVIFVACNRTGSERGSEFAGLSCVMDISNEKIFILDTMKSNTIGVMIVEI
ncbi:carbon-nitrogen hydrolase, partial [Cokeromyces recurvatus]|uniref:carbon-nitrogen hydrolase n=1 Tax=Cokeromyces recurvatus TaxID=90255 RepID=UPI00221E5CB7